MNRLASAVYEGRCFPPHIGERARMKRMGKLPFDSYIHTRTPEFLVL